MEYHPLFWEDVEAQAVFLEAQATLGGEFLNAVEEAVETIRNNPLQWACLYGNTRHYLLKKFRRHIVHYEFFEEANLVRFYGLFHGAENPDKWNVRL